MKKLLSMALVLMMVLTLLAVPVMAADSINITEVNDYGTVTAEVGGTTITVVADTGYYLYSATLNGADILASMTAGYDDVRDGAVCPKEQWTYTAAAPLTAADELVVAYGYYTMTDMVKGGDANTALGTAGAWSTSGTTTIIPEPGNESNNVFFHRNGRLRSKDTWLWEPLAKYLIQYDAKVLGYDGSTQINVEFRSDSTVTCPNGRFYTLPEATADWTTYTTYMDINNVGETDYIYFQTAPAADAYFDNLVVQKLTKAGIVPTFYDINVTEVNDFGVVTADERVAEGATTTIKVVPEEGYYLYSATINGTPVDFTQAYENYDSATAWGYKQVWTYTTAAATEDIDVAITYGYYIYDHMYTGGDAESATHNILNYSTQPNARTDAEASTGSYSFVYDGTRLKGPAFAQAPGEKFIIKWDMKTPSASGAQRVYAYTNSTMPNGRYYDYPATSADWKSYTTYFDVNTALSDYVYFQNSENPTYYDNIVVAKLTEGGKVPTFYDITVTDNGDYGTITADARVAEETATTIKVEPDFGYYLYGATVNGEAVEFTKTFEKVNEAGVFTKKEVWTYDVASVSEDLDVVITYGVYNLEELVVGGDGDSATTNVEIEGAATAAVDVPGETNKAFVTSAHSNFGITRWTSVLGERYVVRFDAKKVVADEATPVIYMYATGIGSWVVEGDGAEYTSLGNEWKSYTNYLDVDPGKFDTPSLYPNSGEAYIDNFSICRITEGGIAGQEPVTPPAPTEFDVTITGENAVVSVAAATSEGEAVNFTVAPKFGYYIESITIGAVDFNGFDAYKGGTYSTGAIEADTEIVVTVAELSANTEDGVSTDVATLPAVFAEAGEAPVTFGKVLADVATVDEFGIYLTKDGEGVTSAKTEMGPHFKAFYNVNGQYAIEFQGLAAGEYVAKTYVKVAGEITYGIATTFTVE